jgi:ubiquitin-activating enzyme E1
MNLIHAFPANCEKEDDHGVKIPFWSGSKRFPRSINYNLEDPLQFSFLFNTTNLYAVMYNLPPVRNPEEFKKLLIDAGIRPPEFQVDKKLMSKVQNEVKEEESKHPAAAGAEATAEKKEHVKPQLDESDEQRLVTLLKTLELVDRKILRPLVKAQFEKDDDKNFHIDFITACSNMRAWNYHIPIATRHKCKMIAGKIIPAVATTTAMITGLVEMELYKLVLGLPIDKFCNSNINLAVSDFKLFEPCGPKGAKEAYDPIEMEVVIPVPPGWTCWDKIIIKGDLTVQEFLVAFSEKHHECRFVSLFIRGDKSSFWLDFPITENQKATVKKNINRKITQIYVERFGEFLEGRDYLRIVGSVENKTRKTVSVPEVLFYFK